MPLIEDRPIKKFKKKAYRPWNPLAEEPVSQTPHKHHKKTASNTPDSLTKPSPSKSTKKDAKLETNRRQTRDKLETNRRQTGDKKNTLEKTAISCSKTGCFPQQKNKKTLHNDSLKPETNRRQTRDKLETNWRQTRDNPSKLETNWRQTRDKLETQLETTFSTNWRQTRDKSSKKNTPSIQNLSGIQYHLICLIFEHCYLTGHAKTERMSMVYITGLLGAKTSSIKKSIQRLEQKKYIHRIDYLEGRSGWTIYGIQKEIYQELLHLKSINKLETNWRQTRDKLETQLETNRSNSSSTIYLDKTTTTVKASPSSVITSPQTHRDNLDVDDDWQRINISPLSDIGFSFNHLMQLKNKTGLSAYDIETSIRDFSNDLKSDESYWKTYLKSSLSSARLRFFMGTLIKSKSAYQAMLQKDEPDDPLAGYIKEQEAVKQKRLEAESEAKALAFENWEASKSPKDLTKVGIDIKLFKTEKMRTQALRSVFEETIWPELKRQFIKKG